MTLYKHVIVGSGPSGIAAALRLEGPDSLILDAGIIPSSTFPYSNLRTALSSGDLEEVLGKNFEMLSNLREPLNCHPKLRAQYIHPSMQGDKFNVLGKDGEFLVKGAGSHSAGGMANAWGAQLLRYSNADLSGLGDWPISCDELLPFYESLEEHIGISGSLDDMSDFLGGGNNLLPPIANVPAARRLYVNYKNLKQSSSRKLNLKLGAPRLAVLTRPYHGKNAYQFGETEFFQPTGGGIYNPKDTLLELIERKKINYLGGHKLISFEEFSDHVELVAENLHSSNLVRIKTRHLLLGCGTIQTSKMILNNCNEPSRRLPFIDHPPTLLPILVPRSIGALLPKTSYPIQLIGSMNNNGDPSMISFYYPGGMLWSDLLMDIPLPLNLARSLFSAIIGGMLVAQIWEASTPTNNNFLTINSGGEVDISYPDRKLYQQLPSFISALKSIGGFSMKRLASIPPPTWGFHHAGTLPMRKLPGAFETHIDGRLWNSKRVRVIDGSVLPSLPAKNHSLTLMANASRIAELTKSCEY